MLGTGPGDLPAVRVWTGNLVWFGSKTVQQPDPQLLGGANPAPYPSTHGSPQVWLDLSGPISGFALRVVLFMVAFRYFAANCKT